MQEMTFNFCSVFLNSINSDMKHWWHILPHQTPEGSFM